MLQENRSEGDTCNQRDSALLAQPINSDGLNRCFVAYCIGLILGYALYIPGRTMPGFPAGGPGDFIIYYTGARIIRDGNGGRLYDLDVQSQVQQTLLIQHGWKYEGGLLPYVNPPFLAGFLVPLSFVPLAYAFHIWNLLCILMLLFCIRTFLPGPAVSRALLVRVVIALSFFPVFESLWQGQSSFVVLLAFTLCYRSLRKHADGEAGIALALGLLKPQLIVVPAATFLFLRRWRTVTAFGLAGIVLVLLSWILVGTDGLVSYLKLSSVMLNWAGVRGMHPTLMPNLRGTVYRMGEWFGFRTGPEATAAWVSTTIVVCGLAVFVLFVRTWHKRCRLGSSEFDLCFAEIVVCSLLLSPHLYGHDLSVLVLAGFLAARYLDDRGRVAQRNRLICLGHMGITLPYLLGLGLELRAQVIAVLLIVLMIMLGRESGFDRRREATRGTGIGREDSEVRGRMARSRE